ncbi:hypothetical protein FH972_022496 [Carpinus fangiana]|uniref:Uncharacterized protein n=1 Tax=Carpinus fangiana TaxID=176857 RepID=A0A5N6KST2_9ROSI|nr:hypothetical protein FH972_022496 [Carpinus fangiana]
MDKLCAAWKMHMNVEVHGQLISPELVQGASAPSATPQTTPSSTKTASAADLYPFAVPNAKIGELLSSNRLHWLWRL